MLTLILLALSPTLAEDDRGPSWPNGAALQVQEAAPSGGSSTEVQLTLTWPAAQDASGVAEYWVFQEQVEHARLNSDTLTWSGSVPPYPPRLTIIAVDSAGNISTRLTSRFAVSEANIAVPEADPVEPADESNELLAALVQEGQDSEQLPAGAAGSEASSGTITYAVVEDTLPSLASVEEGPPNLSLRVGRQGQDETLLDVQFEYLQDGRPSYYLRDGERRMELQLSYEERGSATLWRVELYAQPISRASRLSRLTVRDPLGAESTGACARDTDYDKTGGLWVEVGVDPKGGDPLGACAAVED